MFIKHAICQYITYVNKVIPFVCIWNTIIVLVSCVCVIPFMTFVIIILPLTIINFIVNVKHLSLWQNFVSFTNVLMPQLDVSKNESIH